VVVEMGKDINDNIVGAVYIKRMEPRKCLEDI
jgi:hypothetical protein